MTIRTDYPHQTLRLWTSGDMPVLDAWLGYTPVDADQRRNRTFIVLSVRRPKLPGVLESAWPFLTWFTNRVFDEDREIFPAINELRKLLADCGVPPASRSLDLGPSRT